MIHAYTWPQSIVAGERVALHASCDAGPLDVEVWRQGAYDELVWSARDVGVGAHAEPDDAAENGCRWPVTLEIPTAESWRPGFYLVRLRAGVTASEAFFVVRPREPGRDTSRLLVLSTSTWAAYNDWGGPSYYTGGFRSSLLRPLPKGFLARPAPERVRSARAHLLADGEIGAYLAEGYSFWCIAAGWAQWEHLFVRWLERHGYPVELAVSSDLETVPGLLDPYRLYLSVGHDEYWSAGMRDAVEGFIGRGGHAAFFSGNTAFWQIRWEDDHRAQVSYKLSPELDPLTGSDERHVATMWSDPLAQRPENQLTGVSFTRGGYAHLPNAPTGSGGYTVWRPEHWVFEGTGLGLGDELGAEPVVVGYECDGCEIALRDGLPVATGRDGTPENFEVLATAPAHLWATKERPPLLPPARGELDWVAERLGGADTPENRARFAAGRAVLGSYTRAGTVFTTGCTDWVFGLAADDAGVVRVTRNVLDRLSES